MKKTFFAIITLFILISFKAGAKNPRYVFFFIADGMGINSVYGTELFNAALKGQTAPCPLTFSGFPYRGFVSTYSANSLVTDSSAAGSAMACGCKINSGAMAVDPSGKRLESVAAKARKAGYGTAVVTTTGVNHATPASFYANDIKRGHYTSINEQLLSGEKIDFAAGAGFIPYRKHGSKETSRYWVEKAREKGWNVLEGKKDISKADLMPKTVFVYDSDSDSMPYAMQNPEVTLADMTRAAVQNMVKFHKKGFFMMIEGGRIDYAAHENDAACMFREIMAMDEAVDVAMEFYRSHPDQTLIIVSSDHETGGVTIGNGEYEVHPERLLYQTMTQGDLTNAIAALRGRKDASWEDARKIIEKGLGLWSKVPVTEAEEAELKEIFIQTVKGTGDSDVATLYAHNELLAYKAVSLLDDKAMFHHGVHSHTGAQVPVFAIGSGADQIVMCHDNTEIPVAIARVSRY